MNTNTLDRVIKFRAWDTKELIMLDWLTIMQTAFNIGCTTPLIYTIFDSDRYVKMQFTTLSDMMGVDIYEGDRVSMDGEIGLVRWCSNGGVWVVDFGNYSEYLFWSPKHTQVIGHMYAP